MPFEALTGSEGRELGMAAGFGMWTLGPWDGPVTCKEGWRHMFKPSFGPWCRVTFAIIFHFCNSIDQWYVAMLCNDVCASKFYYLCISMRKQYAISGTMLQLLQLLQLLHNFLIIFCFFNLLHHYYTIITQLSHNYYIIITPLLHHYYTIITSFFHHHYTIFTPLLHNLVCIASIT